MIGSVEGALRDVDILLCTSAMDAPSRIDDAAEVERTSRRNSVEGPQRRRFNGESYNREHR